MIKVIFFSFIAFIFSLIFLRFFINLLKDKGIGKYIRKEGPIEHYKKEGTPVMGGIIFILTLFPFLFLKESFLFAISTIVMGLLGLTDDILLLINKDYGIKPLKKIFLTFIISLILYLIWNPVDHRLFSHNFSINIGSFYPLLFLIIFIFFPNAVNLADGLDGLAGITSFISILFLLIFQLLKNNIIISIAISCLLSSLIGFLWYNLYPAEIFMGDVGAFSLGGAIASLLIINKMEFLFPFIGGIFLLEFLSVFIQVLFYKWKKRRIFKMSPLHHHFELIGWKETKIVGRFSVIHLFIILGGYLIWNLI